MNRADQGLGYALARHVVTEVSPEDLEDFDEVWDAWVKNPKAFAAPVQAGNVSFDPAVAEVVFGGAAAGVAKAVLEFLAAQVGERGARRIIPWPRRPRARVLTSDVVEEAAKIAEIRATLLGLNQDQAKLVGAAVATHLNSLLAAEEALP